MADKRKRGAEDDAYVTYERGRTGGTVRAPASRMVSGVNGTYKGEGGDAVTQRKRVKPQLAGAKASGRVNAGRVGIGIQRRGVGRGFPPGKNRRIYPITAGRTSRGGV